MKVNILGTDYTIFKDNANSHELKGHGRAGYCYFDAREIHIADPDTDDEWKHEENNAIKQKHINRVLRHEIIHAFLYESGLHADTADVEGWAINEEMIDWIALQFPKLQKAFEEAGAL